MGNCVCGGFGDGVQVIKIITSNGGIMEFHTPITVECITNEFPGHGIYKTSNATHFLSNPLIHNEELLPGELYYLLPLGKVDHITTAKDIIHHHDFNGTSSSSESSSSFFTPYRMSFDYQGSLKRSDSEGIRSCSSRSSSGSNSGVWKVKLVISREQLGKILSKETSTEELVNSVRTVAKCGNKGVVNSSSTPSVASSGQWSLSGSCKASCSENFA